MHEIAFKGQKHPVYNIAEARDAGIEFRENWRDGSRGEWVCTDTGYVLQILATGNAGKKRWIRTCCGTFLVIPGQELGHIPREDRYAFGGRVSRPSLTHRTAQFARLYALTGDRRGAYRLAFPTAKSERYIDRRSAELLSVPEIANKVADEKLEIRQRLGINLDWIADEAKALYDDLKKSKSIESKSLRFRLLKFFETTFVGEEVTGKATEVVEYDLTEGQSKALDRGESELSERTPAKHTVRLTREVSMGGKGNGGGNEEDDARGDPGSGVS